MKPSPPRTAMLPGAEESRLTEALALIARTPPVTARFIVRGKPAPKGSMRALMPKGGKQPVVIAGNSSAVKSWEASIRSEAAAAWPYPPTRDAVSVGLEFSMPRPKSHLRTNGQVKPDSPTSVSKKPDIDKLARPVLDALTAVVYADDAQVTELLCSKTYSDTPGVTVAIRRVLCGRGAR